jgi:hypothetical protein
LVIFLSSLRRGKEPALNLVLNIISVLFQGGGVHLINSKSRDKDQKLGHIFDSKFELHQHQSKPIILPLP